MDYRSIIVQQVLSAQMEEAEKPQRHSMFQTFFVIKNRRAQVIIDGGELQQLGGCWTSQEAWLDYTTTPTSVPHLVVQ